MHVTARSRSQQAANLLDYDMIVLNLSEYRGPVSEYRHLVSEYRLSQTGFSPKIGKRRQILTAREG